MASGDASKICRNRTSGPSTSFAPALCRAAMSSRTCLAENRQPEGKRLGAPLKDFQAGAPTPAGAVLICHHQVERGSVQKGWQFLKTAGRGMASVKTHQNQVIQIFETYRKMSLRLAASGLGRDWRVHQFHPVRLPDYANFSEEPKGQTAQNPMPSGSSGSLSAPSCDMHV
jgi:hypothetical protein